MDVLSDMLRGSYEWENPTYLHINVFRKGICL
jgi:hypothetical protein